MLAIFYENDTETAEVIALDKGYRGDVVVVKGKVKYKVYITSMLRLQQDFETEFCDSGFYMSEPNMIIVKEVTKKEIENTINKLNDCGYFERIGKEDKSIFPHKSLKNQSEI